MLTVNNALKCGEPLREVFDVHSNGVLPLRWEGVVFRYQEENRTDQRARATKGQGLKIEGDAPIMATYEACEGTGQRATDIRLMRPTDAKYRHLFGKNAGKCAVCGKSSTLGKGVVTMPRHKAA